MIIKNFSVTKISHFKRLEVIWNEEIRDGSFVKVQNVLWTLLLSTVIDDGPKRIAIMEAEGDGYLCLYLFNGMWTSMI